MNIQTKFSLGDRVWFLRRTQPKSLIIKEIHVSVIDISDADRVVTFIQYRGTGYWVLESECFPSQKALLQSLQTKH